MKSNKFKIVLFLLFITYGSLLSQEILVSREYPTGFRPPLDLNPALAGSFGEIRANHFHSGMDYRTNQREGYPVYAVADGFVSRLRVQAAGFGNAVYISHLNGYTSVYAHLQRLNTRLAQTVKDYQYRKESFEVDFPLHAIEIPVKKGDIIAWSGNTGSSGGPHLHFEIRDSKTEETINPQLFGLNIPDKVSPVIAGLYMYRLNETPFSESTASQYFQIAGGNGSYSLNKAPIINFNGSIGFGLVTYDQQLPGGNKNGVYSIELFLDGKSIYTSVLERFAFADSKAINSYIDYPALIAFGRTIQKNFIDPGNPLSIYPTSPNRGIINLTDEAEQEHQLKYVIKDVKGNTSILNFKIRRNEKLNIPVSFPSGKNVFKYTDSTEYATEKMKISIPENALYNDINLKYSISPRPFGAYSEIHHIHDRAIPIHTKFYLYIKPDLSLPEYLKEKAVIVNTRGVYQGGTFGNGFVKASPKAFGSFYIRVDTIAPLIRPVNITDGKLMKGIDRITLKLSDNLSGIHSYRGTIDGQWVLFSYDLKSSTLWHTFEKDLGPGKHTLQFLATDMKMNIRTFNATFYK